MSLPIRSLTRALTRASRPSSLFPSQTRTQLSKNVPRLTTPSTSIPAFRTQLQSHAFSTTTFRAKARTMGQLRARNSTGPFSWKAALLFVLTGGGMIVYFRVEKERLERKRIAEMSKGVGRPKVGGPFVLRDLNGEVFTEEALKGRYSFVRLPFFCTPELKGKDGDLDSLTGSLM